MDIQQGAIGHAVAAAGVSGATAIINSSWVEVSGRPVSCYVEPGSTGSVTIKLQGSWNGIDAVEIGLVPTATHTVFSSMGWPFVRYALEAIDLGQLGQAYVMAIEYTPE